MSSSEAVKQEALHALEKAHRVRSEGLLERLRIFNGSLYAWNELWRKLKQMRFISFADAEPFDAKAAEVLVANADAIVADAAGIPREYIVVLGVYQDDFTIICASLSEATDAPAVAVFISGVSGKASLLSWGADRRWERGAEGGLRLRKTQASTPESGAQVFGGDEIDAH
jgi:hypothetical protein